MSTDSYTEYLQREMQRYHEGENWLNEEAHRRREEQRQEAREREEASPRSWGGRGGNMDKVDLNEMNYLDSAKEIWENTGDEKPNTALWTIAAALISLAESHRRVADALEKIHADMPDVDLGRIASAVDFMAQADALPPNP